MSPRTPRTTSAPRNTCSLCGTGINANVHMCYDCGTKEQERPQYVCPPQEVDSEYCPPECPHFGCEYRG